MEVSKAYPVSQDGEGPIFRVTNGTNRIIQFYICAPSVDFDHRKTIIVGNEIVSVWDSMPTFEYKFSMPRLVLDPVVLFPLRFRDVDEAFFHVVSAWGPESLDPRIFNEGSN